MPSQRIRGIAVAAVLFAVSVDSAAAASDADVRVFAHAPAFALPTLSPDAAYLSYAEQSGGRQTVVLRAVRDGAQRSTLSVESKRERIRWCDWAGPAHLLCGTIVPIRRPERVSEQTRLYAIDAADGRIRELNARLSDPVRDDVIDLLQRRPSHVLLQHDPVGRGYPEVSELDVTNGALRRVVRTHPPITRWMSDGRGEIRLGISYGGATASLFVRRPGSADDWTVFLRQSLTDPEAIGPLAIAADPDELYVVKHHQGRAALFRTNTTRSDVPSLLFAHDVYDVGGPLILDPRTRALLAVQYLADHEERHFFDAAEAALQARLNQRLPGTVNLVVSATADGRYRLVRSVSDTDAPSLYLFDVDRQSVRLVGHQYPQLEGRELARMRPMTYRARDGQIIPAYLTLPVNGKVNGLPAIVLPHGGPETRTIQTFDPLVQFLAAQGYAVLQMNFRGSIGYGARFTAAGAGQWGGVIHNDITDGARWLVEQKLADPARLCIVGISFGGYSALLGAARESAWYACAASFAGPTDLMAFAQYTQRLQGAGLWKERLGGDQRALWQMSPMARVRAIETPVLIVHGRNDPVVPVRQARRFARALRQADKPHQFIERADCDHEMTVAACRLVFFEELAKFLQRALGSESRN